MKHRQEEYWKPHFHAPPLQSHPDPPPVIQCSWYPHEGQCPYHQPHRGCAGAGRSGKPAADRIITTQRRRRAFCGAAFFVHGGDLIYIYPDNLNAKATLWLWQLRDLAVIGIGLLIAVLALTQLGLFLPMVLVAAYAFLSIHLDGLSVLDFLSFVVSFYLTEQQLFEWEGPA